MTNKNKDTKSERQLTHDESTECFAFQELDRYFLATSDSGNEIEQHLKRGCVRCSAYLDVWKMNREKARGIRTRFFDSLEKEMQNGFPLIRQECDRLQRSSEPKDRLVAARMRYALNTHIEVVKFRLPRRLQDFVLHDTRQERSDSKIRPDRSADFTLKMVEPEWVDGQLHFKLAVFPATEKLGAELILENGERLPMSVQENDNLNQIWITPIITAEGYLALRGGEWLVAVELFANAEANKDNPVNVNVSLRVNS